MARNIFGFFFYFLFAIQCSAQTGAVSGEVLDSINNQPLIGATIGVVNSTVGSVADIDGKFMLTGMGPGEISLRVSYVGYNTKEISGITIVNNQTILITVLLGNSNPHNLSGVVIHSELKKENIAAMLTMKKNSAVVSDAISADQIKKSPDKNTSEVLKRVSGITIQDNKFVVIRGMNDRYNDAMINGALLPSTEPDRKTFSFDIFPSSVVDNITIIKSTTPDLPGDFSGGLVQVNTKDIPDKNFFSIKTGAGYYSLTTFKHYAHSAIGKKDWIGLDDGTRDLDPKFPTTDEYLALSSSDKNSWSQKFANTWGIIRNDKAPLNTNVQIVGGFNLLKGNYPKLGGIIGVTYNNSRKTGFYQRLDYGSQVTDTVYHYYDSAYNRNVLASALANLGFRLNANNKFYFNNLYSINSNNQAVVRDGNNPSGGWQRVVANSFFFSSNKILNSQLAGEHYIPKIKLKIKWQGYHAHFDRDEPDYRRNQYVTDDTVNTPLFALVTFGTSTATNAGVRYYANLHDDARGFNLDLSRAFKMFNNTQTIKFGGAYYFDQRSRDARIFTAAVANSSNFNFAYLFSNQDTLYAPSHFNESNGFTMIEDNTPTNHYDGWIENMSGYIMFDNKFNQFIRLVCGIRSENYQSILNTFTVDTKAPYRRDTTYHDLLPSANLIFAVLKNANLRFCFSQSVARPQYREMANQLFYDFLTNTTYSGNPGLVETHINNYEIRWEHYFASAQYYSISGFHKTFVNPIEQQLGISGGDSRTVQFVNVKSATNDGIELEARKNFAFLGKQFESFVLYSNVTFIESRVSVEGTSDTSGIRPLQGQSPFIFNASLQYLEPKTNIGLSILYNKIGRRIFLVGSAAEEPVWETTHPSLDAKISKTFLKNGLVEFTWADILHSNDYQYRDLNKNKKFDGKQDDRLMQKLKSGPSFSIAVSYQF